MGVINSIQFKMGLIEVISSQQCINKVIIIELETQYFFQRTDTDMEAYLTTHRQIQGNILFLLLDATSDMVDKVEKVFSAPRVRGI